MGMAPDRYAQNALRMIKHPLPNPSLCTHGRRRLDGSCPTRSFSTKRWPRGVASARLWPPTSPARKRTSATPASVSAPPPPPPPARVTFVARRQPRCRGAPRLPAPLTTRRTWARSTSAAVRAARPSSSASKAAAARVHPNPQRMRRRQERLRRPFAARGCS